VSPGEDVTLLCQSQSLVDTFFLSKGEAASPLLHLRSTSWAQQHQAEFSMTAVISALGEPTSVMGLEAHPTTCCHILVTPWSSGFQVRHS
jgi:hypothetical protein